MKTILSIITASFLLASVSANASQYKRTETDTLTTSFAASKAAAYQLGMDKLLQLKAIPQYKLRYSLHAHSGNRILQDTLRIDKGAYITVQERMVENGTLGYVGLVNIAYSYTEDDNEN